MAVAELTYYERNRERLKARRMERYHENRDAILSANRERYALDQEYRERIRNHCKNQYQKNPDLFKKRARRWFAENEDHAKVLMADRTRRWAESHRSERVDAQSRRRAAVAGNGDVEKFTRDDVFARSFGLCGVCGTGVDPEAFHVDHIFPLSRGGGHTLENVQAAHPRCNIRKGARVL